ncbi:hypothetical protein [Stenomitos frigidus]|nr:hypothetical protein [Stenomitos frigidus]
MNEITDGFIPASLTTLALCTAMASTATADPTAYNITMSRADG